MSVDIDWQTLTEGPDGEALAETIRAFVHERFQQISLPKLIRSVKCHSFDFGTIAPNVVLKDICNPLPDFYEDDTESEGSALEKDSSPPAKVTETVREPSRGPREYRRDHRPSNLDSLRQAESLAGPRGAATPGFRGGSTLGYFHMPLSAGLSGTNTPLAAVAGAHYQQGQSEGQEPHPLRQHHHADSFSSISPPPSNTPPSRAESGDHSSNQQRHASTISAGSDTPVHDDRSPEDLQVVYHVTYSGNVRLSMTTEVFLDYPMPSFVGIPLKLNITGVNFDGVGILAYIKKKAHLCFLPPEDAEALIGGEDSTTEPHERRKSGSENATERKKVGQLLEHIKIESEMGETDSGKQVLKNVGKIEKFILEQVQRIFEDEFVYPSFWTFLV
ncbi:hypothetical protein KC347_g7438 [Hortaea werneckii]|nr:hypothetical protein KC347_g7438 [Hortaea werneckii]